MNIWECESHKKLNVCESSILICQLVRPFYKMLMCLISTLHFVTMSYNCSTANWVIFLKRLLRPRPKFFELYLRHKSELLSKWPTSSNFWTIFTFKKSYLFLAEETFASQRFKRPKLFKLFLGYKSELLSKWPTLSTFLTILHIQDILFVYFTYGQKSYDSFDSHKQASSKLCSQGLSSVRSICSYTNMVLY